MTDSTSGISVRKFAALVGVSPAAISKAIRSGRLSVLADGTIDPVVGASEWANTSSADARPSGMPGASPAASSIGSQAALARAMKSSYEAKLLELEFKRRNGELVLASEVEAQAFSAARRVRERLLSVAARLAPVVAGMTEVSDCYEALEREMLEVCDELSSSGGRRA